MEQEKYEIVKFVDNGFELEVNVSPAEDTVWLSQQQMSELFDVDRTRITRHLNAAIQDGEITEASNVRKTHFTGSFKPAKLYDLEAIVAIGYRVKSQRGVIFRRWATSVLKQYMLKGYAIDSSRVLVTQENYLDLVNVVNRIDSTQSELITRIERLEAKYPVLNTYVFACGQMFDATSFLVQIIGKSEREIILIDNYIDRGTLDILSHKAKETRALIITSEVGNRVTPKEYQTFNAQYCNLTINTTDKVHDRFLILDGREMYHIGASLKDAGRKLFGMELVNNPEIIRFVLENAL